jgi:hypothetical protein
LVDNGHVQTLSFFHMLGTGDFRAQLHVGGVATVRPEGLALEWRPTRVAYTRVISAPERAAIERRLLSRNVEQRVIPWTQLEAVSYRGLLLGRGTLTVRALNIGSLDGLPGESSESWSALVAWRDRLRARDFVLAAEAELRK